MIFIYNKQGFEASGPRFGILAKPAVLGECLTVVIRTFYWHLSLFVSKSDIYQINYERKAYPTYLGLPKISGHPYFICFPIVFLFYWNIGNYFDPA